MIVGWGKKGKRLGSAGVRDCPDCGNRAEWQMIETSKKVSVYFVRVAKLDTAYFAVCPICTNGVTLASRTEAQALLAAATET